MTASLHVKVSRPFSQCELNWIDLNWIQWIWFEFGWIESIKLISYDLIRLESIWYVCVYSRDRGRHVLVFYELDEWDSWQFQQTSGPRQRLRHRSVNCVVLGRVQLIGSGQVGLRAMTTFHVFWLSVCVLWTSSNCFHCHMWFCHALPTHGCVIACSCRYLAVVSNMTSHWQCKCHFCFSEMLMYVCVFRTVGFVIT